MGKWAVIISFCVGICLTFIVMIFLFMDAIIPYYYQMKIGNTSKVYEVAKNNSLLDGNDTKFHRVAKFMNESWRERPELIETGDNNVNDLAVNMLGDCEDKAILFLSLYDAIGGEDYYFIHQPRHACAGAYINGSLKTYGCLDEPYLSMKKVG